MGVDPGMPGFDDRCWADHGVPLFLEQVGIGEVFHT